MPEAKKLDRQNVEDILALTPLQEGMLFHYLNEPESEQYFEQLSLRLTGDISMERVKKAWNFVVETNEMLRTVFRWEAMEKPVQIVLKKQEIPFIEYDLREFESEDRRKAIDEIRAKDRKEKIRIDVCTFRIKMCRLDEHEYEMIISNHHIIYDGWSTGIILKEFLSAYKDFANFNEPIKQVKTKYKEFIRWYQRQDKEGQRDYWTKYMAGFEAKTQLPSYSINKERISSPGNFTHTLQSELTNEIRAFVRENQLTVANLLYCAWGILLQRYSNTGDVVFGTTVSGRTPHIRGIEEMIGLFINTIPLRVTEVDDEDILSFLKRIGSMLKEREEFEYTPLTDIKSYSKSSSREGLFDSIIVLSNYPLDEMLGKKDNIMSIDAYTMFEMTNFDLTVGVTVFDDISIKFIYNTGVFEDETVNKLAGHFINILSDMVRSSRKKLTEIEMLSEEEKGILFGFNNTNANYPKDRTVHQLFEEQVEKTPGSIALVFEDSVLTYSELNTKANKLAALLRKKGVRPGTLVGIMMERSPEMIIGILGILKAGGAYLPVDPNYPMNRIQLMLEDSKPPIILVKEGFERKAAFDEMQNCDVIMLDSICSIAADETVENPLNITGQDDMIYQIYTSGSTGNPKGAMIKSHSFVNLLNWFTKEFGISERDNILLIAPISFDLAQKNLYSSLIKGGKLCLFSPGLFDYNKMSELIQKENISIINCTPSAFYPLMDFNKDTGFKRLKSLRWVFLGGEPINVNKLTAWTKSSYYNARIVNTYGPTECTDIATFYTVDSELAEGSVTVPIGKPIHNTQVYVVDRDIRLLPVGVAGELCISGVGMGKGYYNAPELTQEKFVGCSYAESGRVYRTGDLVRWMPDGNIEFLGRIDHQVKIRGYRIELGDIEAELLSHSSIKEAVVIAREDFSGSKYLCAYIVSDIIMDSLSLKEFLAKQLPDYMIPAHFVLLDKLPLTPSGKINRNGLPAPDAAISSGIDFKAPTNEAEMKLVELWQKVLGIERAGINDNFFDIGGNSILLVQLHAQIEKVYPGKVAITDLFSNPTIAKQAAFINKDRETGNTCLPVSTLVLPEEFFFNGYGENEGSTFRFSLGNDLLEKLEVISKKESVELCDILLSMYAYVFAEFSGEKSLTVQAVTEKNNIVTPVSIDLDTMEGFTQLFAAVRREQKTEENSKKYNIRDVSRVVVEKEKVSVIPLFCKRSLIAGNTGLTDTFDIVLEIFEEGGHIYFALEYNGKRLKREAMKELINGYSELIEILTEKYLKGDM
ncbi:MAG: amino acid adenylation domain-containing protein [Clostridia bacterium]|nr:amino acid adenylation domain-containing protein [Clostridia bacterium]